ncbi:hypothetical protein TPA0909_45950 [Streptomyces albus]|nr:hypothetical protein TPA0909_45950 [Streptomyces albus]
MRGAVRGEARECLAAVRCGRPRTGDAGRTVSVRRAARLRRNCARPAARPRIRRGPFPVLRGPPTVSPQAGGDCPRAGRPRPPGGRVRRVVAVGRSGRGAAEGRSGGGAHRLGAVIAGHHGPSRVAVRYGGGPSVLRAPYASAEDGSGDASGFFRTVPHRPDVRTWAGPLRNGLRPPDVRWEKLSLDTRIRGRTRPCDVVYLMRSEL